MDIQCRVIQRNPYPSHGSLSNGETSSDWVALTGFDTTDPEGDPVRFEFHSDIDGILASGSSPEPLNGLDH